MDTNIIIELKKIGHRNINTDTTLLLKAILSHLSLIKFYVAVAYYFFRGLYCALTTCEE